MIYSVPDNKPHLPHPPITDTTVLTTPARTITPIGFILYFWIMTRLPANINTIIQFVFDKITAASFPQNAVIKMEIPAEAIIATTAGLREFKIPCSIVILRYFKYKRANSVTMTQEGRIHPSVATAAPGIPAILIPTKVAELIAIGPGVICEIVIRSVNSFMLSQPCSATTCP